ncbi:C-type lectin domain family 10 member A-like [Polypterus senegalus]
MIKSTEELNFIMNHTVREIWIGLRKENEKWNWIDGTTFQNNIFKEGIQQVKAGMDCVMIMKSGLMYAAPCKTRYHWVCEKITLQK